MIPAWRLTRHVRASPLGPALPYACATAVSAGASVALVLLLTRLLTPAGYGLYAAVTGTATIAQGGYLAWQTSIVRFHPRAGDAGGRARLATAIRAAFALTTLAVAGLWGVAIHWLGSAGVTAPLALAGFALLAARGWLSLVQAWNRAEDRLWGFFALEAVQAAGGLVLVTVALRLGPGDPAGAIGASTLAVLVATACAPSLLLAPVRVAGTRALLRELFRYGGPLMLVQLATALLAVSDRLIVAVHAGAAAAGAYAVAFSVADRLLGLLLLPIPLAINPRLFAAWESDRAAAARLIETIGRWLMLLGLPLVTLLAMLPGPITRLVAGAALARDAAPLVPWLAAGSFLAVLLTLYFALPFQLSRRTGPMLAVVGVPAVLNVIANLLLIPRYGATAAAITTVAAYALGIALAIPSGRREVTIPLPLRPLAEGTALSALLAAALAVLA